MKEDKFAFKASNYDEKPRRVKNSKEIGDKIKARIALKKNMHIVDFGAGTGLLLQELAPVVEKITAIDISPSMIKVLKEKNLPCKLDILELDLSKEDITIKADGIISSMTMHHIKDTKAMFQKLHSILKPGGFIAIADLDTEDGSFHTEDTGVEHFGFDREKFTQIAKKAGFKNCTIEDATIIPKSHGDYSVFLLTAYK